jgi:phage terminase Nu1 subunit (DNA packaging protein)
MAMTTEHPPKRGRGRPRNQALDALQKELAISRRHAASMLREQKAAAAGISDKGPSPLARARLDKTLSEIRFLEIKIRTAELEERAMSGELLYLDEAKELVVAATSAIANSLRGMPKTLSPRLFNQPQTAIEKTLLDFVDNTLAQCAAAVAKVDTSRKI